MQFYMQDYSLNLSPVSSYTQFAEPMTSTAPKMDNIPIVSPQKIATRIGFKIGSIVEVSDAVTGETRSNPLDKNTYDNPNCTIPNTRTYPQTVGVNTVSRIKNGIPTTILIR